MDTKSAGPTSKLIASSTTSASSVAIGPPALTDNARSQQRPKVDAAAASPQKPASAPSITVKPLQRTALATGGRISHTVMPRAYDVTLNASLTSDNHSGSVTIDVDSAIPTDRIELNARGLTLSNITATVGTTRIAGKAIAHPESETVEIAFDHRLPKGPSRLSMDFAGALQSAQFGLYRARDGEDQAFVTQCEPADARSIFPCFDEPDFKATYSWSVSTDKGLSVIANGKPISVEATADGRELHRFEKTEPISSYAIATTIGKYESTPERIIGGVPCRVYALEGKAKLGEFALDVTAQVLPFYVDYFAQPYAFGKLDHVGVPGMDAGGMENVGAIFYRQTALLMQPGATPWQTVKRIASVVAHEIGHMWFGNLVTMKWWDDLWLNEAFTEWVSYKALTAVKPEWRLWDDFVVGKNAGLIADALENTHPIYTTIETPGQANENFDVITYQKGSSVLRMCEGFLGEEAFRAGIRSYMRAFRLGNATGTDLWRHLGKASGQPVEQLMRSWIEQKGFPLVSLERQGNTLRLHQQQFFSDPKAMAKGSDQTWAVPLVIRCGGPNGVTTKRYLLQSPDDTIELPEGTTWFYANSDSTGFYRCKFAEADKARLLSEGLAQMTPNERTSLLSDEWALVRSGTQPIGAFLDVVKAFRGDTDYSVNRDIGSYLSSIERDLIADADREKFRAFVQWFHADATGLDPTQPAASDFDGARRASILATKGVCGRDPVVAAQAKEFVTAEMASPEAVDANLADTLLQVAAANGNAELLDKYVATYRARCDRGSAPALQTRYLSAMVAFDDDASRSRVLNMCVDGTVPSENVGITLSRMMTKADAWEFLKANWNTISSRVGNLSIARLVEATGSLPDTLAADVEAFFAAHPVPAAAGTLKKALEQMRLRAEFKTRAAPDLAQWMKTAPTA